MMYNQIKACSNKLVSGSSMGRGVLVLPGIQLFMIPLKLVAYGQIILRILCIVVWLSAACLTLTKNDSSK